MATFFRLITSFLFSLNHEHVIWAALFVTWNSNPHCFGWQRFGLAFCDIGGLMIGARPNSGKGELGLAMCGDGGLMSGAWPNSGRSLLG